MATLPVFEFPYDEPWDGKMADAKGLATDIASEPALLWKVRTESSERGTGGGAYLFESEHTALDYAKKHSARLDETGISSIDVRQFDVNAARSLQTNARV